MRSVLIGPDPGKTFPDTFQLPPVSPAPDELPPVTPAADDLPPLSPAANG